MKYLLTIFIFLFICISLSAQKKDSLPITKQNGLTMSKQDSVNVFIKLRDAALDSIVSKTSLKDFQSWLDENISSKMMREGKLNELWAAFINAKLDEWIRKNKIVIPKQ